MDWLMRFLVDESGPTAVEYAIMLALIMVVCIAAIWPLGKLSCSIFNNTGNNALGS